MSTLFLMLFKYITFYNSKFDRSNSIGPSCDPEMNASKILPWIFSWNWIYKILYITFCSVGWLVVEFRSIFCPRDLGLKDEFPLREIFRRYPTLYNENFNENHENAWTARSTSATKDWIGHLSSTSFKVEPHGYCWGYMIFWYVSCLQQ